MLLKRKQERKNKDKEMSKNENTWHLSLAL